MEVIKLMGLYFALNDWLKVPGASYEFYDDCIDLQEELKQEFIKAERKIKQYENDITLLSFNKTKEGYKEWNEKTKYRDDFYQSNINIEIKTCIRKQFIPKKPPNGEAYRAIKEFINSVPI